MMTQKTEATDSTAATNDVELPHATMGRSSPKTSPQPSDIAVSIRPQTPEEQRQTESALQVFLTELVRQHLQSHGTKT